MGIQEPACFYIGESVIQKPIDSFFLLDYLEFYFCHYAQVLL